jgi:hypothetical protein
VRKGHEGVLQRDVMLHYPMGHFVRGLINRYRKIGGRILDDRLNTHEPVQVLDIAGILPCPDDFDSMN